MFDATIDLSPDLSPHRANETLRMWWPQHRQPSRKSIAASRGLTRLNPPHSRKCLVQQKGIGERCSITVRRADWIRKPHQFTAGSTPGRPQQPPMYLSPGAAHRSVMFSGTRRSAGSKLRSAHRGDLIKLAGKIARECRGDPRRVGGPDNQRGPTVPGALVERPQSLDLHWIVGGGHHMHTSLNQLLRNRELMCGLGR